MVGMDGNNNSKGGKRGGGVQYRLESYKWLCSSSSSVGGGVLASCETAVTWCLLLLCHTESLLWILIMEVPYLLSKM